MYQIQILFLTQNLTQKKSPTVKLAALRSAEIFFNRHIVRCLHSCTPTTTFYLDSKRTVFALKQFALSEDKQLEVTPNRQQKRKAGLR
ncbi:hypothetical protein PGIN_7BTORR_01891 [Porphyromonas gingivalis]|nr:hypothetical protein PGIN_7BTORR_01891 [Porphyromonas gingivalis]